MLDLDERSVALLSSYLTLLSGHWTLDSDYELFPCNRVLWPLVVMTTFLVTHLSLICHSFVNSFANLEITPLFDSSPRFFEYSTCVHTSSHWHVPAAKVQSLPTLSAP